MALTRITKGVIKPNENYDTHNINSTGIVTAIGLDVNGNGDISGNLSVGGVLTYEDVTSIDSVGIITARGGIDCNGDLDVDGHTNLDNGNVAGIVTFNSGSALHMNGGQLLLFDRPDGNSNNLFFGTGGRAVAYHDGTGFSLTNNVGHAYIGVGVGSKDLYLYAQASGNVLLQQNTGVRYVKGVGSNASVELFFNNSLRLNTTNAGVSIPKDLDVDGHTNLDNVSVAGILTATEYRGGGSTGIKVTSAGKVLIGTSTQGSTSADELTIENTGPMGISLRTNSTGESNVYFADGTSGTDRYTGYIAYQHQYDRFRFGVNGGQLAVQINEDKSLNLYAGLSVSGIATATGADINGDLDVDGHTNLDNVSIAGIVTVSNTAPGVHFIDTNADSDFMAQVDTGVFKIVDLTNSSATRVVINSVGKLGINEVNPTEMLHIKAEDNTDNYGGIIVYANNNSVYTKHGWRGLDSNEAIRFAISGTEKMRLTNGGKLALGRTSADEMMHITNDDNTDNYGGIKIGANNGSVTVKYGWRGIDGSETLRFAIGGNEKLRISNNGNVNVYNDLDVDGHTNLDNVSIAGITTVNSSLTVVGQIFQSRPSDFWSSTSAFFEVAGLGNFTTQGSYETTLTSNGYRDTNGQWKSYAINSYTGAAAIRLNPQGYIIFGAESSKSNGSTHVVTERLRIDQEGIRSPGGTFNIRNSGSTGNVTINVLGVSGDSRIDLENTGNGNYSGIDFIRERSSGAGVVGGSIFMKSDTSSNDAYLYIQAQSASAQSPVTTALSADNGVRLKLQGGDGIFAIETGASERLRILSSGELRIISSGNNNDPAHLRLHSADVSISTNDAIGVVRFAGRDSGGSNVSRTGALIQATAAATWDTGQSSGYSATHLDFFTQSNSGTDTIAAGARLRIDSSGRVLIGTTTEGETTADNLTIADSGNCGITIRSGTSAEGNIFFSDGTSGVAEYRAIVRYEHNNDAFVIKTLGSDRLRIDSDGNVRIANTTTSPTGDFRMLTLIARSDKQASIGFAQASGVYSGATATAGYTVRLAGDAALELATHNSNIIALKATQTGNVEMVGDLSTNNLSGRNIVINGDMRVAQRATSANFDDHGNDIEVCDRWNYNRHGVTATCAQVADAPAASGFKYSLKWTSTSAVSGSLHAGNNLKWLYQIEGQHIRRLGYGASGAKKATLSFWAKGSLAGKIGVSCVRDSRVFSANVDMTANTWEFHQIVIPADTSTGFSANDTANGFQFGICWGGGSNSTSGTTGGNWINYHNAYTAGFTAGQQGAYLTTNGSTFYITGVQLEIGSQATPFEFLDYGDQLKMCQRYFSIYHPTTQEWIYFEGAASNHKWWQTYIPTGMRSEPSVTKKGTCSTNNISAGGGTISSLSVENLDNGGNSGTTHPGSMGRCSFRVTFTGNHGSARQVYHADGWGHGNGWIEYDSEL